MQDLRQGFHMVYELGIRPTKDTTAPDRESDRRSVYVCWSLEKERPCRELAILFMGRVQ